MPSWLHKFSNAVAEATSLSKAIALCLASSASLTCFGRHVIISISDRDTKQPVEFASVSLTQNDTHIGGLTTETGEYLVELPPGDWGLVVSAVGYNVAKRLIISPTYQQRIQLSLIPSYTQLGEVVVTAREGRGITSTSLIDQKAMEHLQPSSFTDLLELLPGAISKDPEMGKANLANLREAKNIAADGYDTSSLGTSFVLDGVPVNTNAEMQTTADATHTGRLTTGKGVDMRSISTDDIESVEVVRGIASAEYGEVTSGVINIKRKIGESALTARFKADMQSQLFYIGKGVKMPSTDWTMNFSADYLDSKIDPRNSRENFKRITASARSTCKWHLDKAQLAWNSSVNYTGTFERDKNDPDLTVNNTTDFYTSDKHGITWGNTLSLTPSEERFFRNLNITTGLSYTSEQLHQEKTIASSRLYPMPVSTHPGSNSVGYLPMKYEAVLNVDGKPLTAYIKFASTFRYALPFAAAQLKAGAEWNMSKNLGKGQIYDLMRPITAGNTTRPRAFSDVPAMHQLSFYAEHTADIHLGQHAVELQTGLRETQLLHLPSNYHLHNRLHFDPRINIKWSLPFTFMAGFPIGWELAGGFGWHTKMPVAAFLYPDARYSDFVQLNYFHNNPAYRAMYVYTFVEDTSTPSLKAARNFKWEVRGDITYRNNRLSLTYFREDMKNAFRQAGIVHFYAYEKFDASQYNPDHTGTPPSPEHLPHETERRTALINHPTNSSRVQKEGVEFTFSSCRIPMVRTRITVSGAWLRTTLGNSEDLWYKPSSVVNGKELQYVGLYNDREGNVYQSFNTNFTFDTDVPRLGLNFSIAVQNMWFTSSRQLWRDGIPQWYVGADGIVHPYTAEMMSDPYLGQLVRTYTDTSFDERRVPVATTFNIKATKKFWNDRVGIAIYVNRLVSITPDYTVYGSLQRRYTSPYFGMEINLRL